MDKWKDLELEKMKVGGNRKAKEFLESEDSWNECSRFNDRYNSLAAALYRDKISALAEGRSWDYDEAKKRLAKRPSSHIPHSKSASALSSNNYSSGNNYEASSGGGYQNAETNLKEFKDINDQKEKYFDRIQAENAMRRDDLPPSQGGRYQGFGNQVQSNAVRKSQSEFFDTTWSSFSSGWGLLSNSATKLAQTAKDYGNIASQKMKETNLLDVAGKEVFNIANKVTDLGRKGLQTASSAISGAAYNDIDNQQQQQKSNYEQNPFGNDWTNVDSNGFTDDDKFESYQSYESPKSVASEKTSIKSNRPKPQASDSLVNDFKSMDVKSGIKVDSSKKTNKQEDDLWDMLNN